MSQRELSTVFFVRLVVVYLVLLFPWPGLGPFFAGVYADAATAILSVTTDSAKGGTVHFLRPRELEKEKAEQLFPEAGGESSWDVVMFATSRRTGQAMYAVFETRRRAYIPCAIFLALSLACPMLSWRRRLPATLGGLVLLQSLVVIMLVAELGSGQRAQVFDFDAGFHTLFVMAYRTLVLPLGMAYAVPILLWLILMWSFDRDSLKLTLMTRSTPALSLTGNGST